MDIIAIRTCYMIAVTDYLKEKYQVSLEKLEPFLWEIVNVLEEEGILLINV